MKAYSHISLTLTMSMALLSSCGSSKDDSGTTGRNLVVEVGDGVPGLALGDETDEGADKEDTQEKEIQQCKDLFGQDVTGWKIAGSENELSIEANQAFAVKITGDSNILNLTIKAKEGETGLVSFPGICLVLGGNKPTVNATLKGVALEKFKLVAKGNDGSVNIQLQGGATLPEGATEENGKYATVKVTESAE